MSSRPAVPPPHAAWLVLPEVSGAIEGVLRRKGLHGADLEDHRQSVLERAYVVAQAPETRADCVALVRKIAREMAIDTYRRSRRRAKVDAGLCEDPDERPPPDAGRDAADAIDARRGLALIHREIEAGNITDRQAAILRSAVDDVPQPQIAAQMSLAHSTVRNELSVARRVARASWATFAAVVLYVLGRLLCDVLLPDHVAAPPPEPSESAPPPAPTPRDIADETRRRALHACDLGDPDACLRGLDEARSLDPAGDRAPRIQRARDRAERAIEARNRQGDNLPSMSGSTPAPE
jgi:DNA-directed RNA polymerase specialized sigma24 family protein